MFRTLLGACLALSGAALCQPVSSDPRHWLFSCYSGKHAKNAIDLTPMTIYSEASKAGFDLGTVPVIELDSCHSDKPFFFSVPVAEGSYRVTLEIGGMSAASVTTVKAESRRLMLFALATRPNQSLTKRFNVSVRTKYIAAAHIGESPVEVHLKPREIGSLDWDGKLTLEFSGQNPSVRRIEISRVDDAPTLYLAGDSTVVDQDKEPWAAWGQILPRFFNDKVSISNQAESGETIRSFVTENRLAKIASTLRAGDYLFTQFAHNDQKPGSGLVTISEYKQYLVQYIELARNKGAVPVLVTSMNRRKFDDNGKIIETLGDYPDAMRQVAREQNVPLIELNAMSKSLFEAMGPELTLKAFVHFPANTFPDQPEELKDDTHFTAYGAYELARCVVKGARDAKLPIASSLLKDGPRFDPSAPDAYTNLTFPQDPQWSAAAPYGR